MIHFFYRLIRRLIPKKTRALLISILNYSRYKDNPEINRAIDTFENEEDKKDKRFLAKTRRKLYYNRSVYSITPSEYYLYHFDELSDIGKRKYVGDIERERIMNRVISEYTYGLFVNKYNTYKHFSKYYKRRMLRVTGQQDREAFDQYIKTSKDIIIKPIRQSTGTGIFKADCSSANFSSEQLFSEILSIGEVVIEDCVHQCAKMAAFHPNSVNTVRMLTKINPDGSVDLIGSFLRTGRHGTCVDNGGRGGLLIGVDTTSGITTSKGISEKGEAFVCHPDTGVCLLGFQIPRWEEAIALSKELATVVPEQAVVGWDLALTDEGWLMIEGNCKSMFIGWQLTSGKGYRDTLNRYFKEWL